MATLAELIARRDALLSVRAAGTREVEYDGKRIVYRSDAEIATAIADIERQISQASGAGRISTVYINSSKGV